MDKLEKIIKQRLAERGLLKTTEGAQVCFYAKEWADTLFQPISFTRGVLKVFVKSSSAAQSLQMREEELILFLNAKMKREIVRRIRISCSNY